MHEDLGDGLAGKWPVGRRRLMGLVVTGAGERVGAVVVGEDEARLRDPVDRLELLRGDEGLRTRKQTHQLPSVRVFGDARVEA